MRDFYFLHGRFHNLLKKYKTIDKTLAARILNITEGQLLDFLATRSNEYDIKGNCIIFNNKDTILNTQSEEPKPVLNSIPIRFSKSRNCRKNPISEDVELTNFLDIRITTKEPIKPLNKFVIDWGKENTEKKKIMIPKISQIDQIYWICEICGISNPYFLGYCKDCASERPNEIYTDFEENVMSKRFYEEKFKVSKAISSEWQSIKDIARKLELKKEKEIQKLKDKLNRLVQQNYLISNSTKTKFRLNDFKM